MCNTWDVDGLLEQIPNRLYMEWLVYWGVKAEYEEAAVKKIQREGSK